jgi:ribosome modulation factor
MAMPFIWWEGYDAAAQGKSATDDCPYEFDSVAMKEWLSGYEAWLDDQENEE